MNSDKGKVSRSGSGFSGKEPPKKRPNTEQRTSTSSNSAYKTRCSDGSGFKKSRRYSPDLPTRRKRRDGGNASLNSSDTTDSTITKSSPISSDEESVDSTSTKAASRTPDDRTPDEAMMDKTDDALARAHPPETEYETQFKKALRLYRYMALPDSGGKRPVYRAFLSRNLWYMNTKNCARSGSNDSRMQRARNPKLRSMEHRRGNIRSVIHNIHKRVIGKEHVKRTVVSTTKRPSSRASSAMDVDKLRGGDKHANCSHTTSVLRFVDVRNNDLPGTRHAMITLYLCTEIDGRFGEITRLPSATVQMAVNSRGTPVSIDLPRGIGCPLDCVGKERNDYVIIRVTFSGEEDARMYGGRTLRGTPSRKAGKGDLKMSRRSTTTASSKKSSRSEDSSAVYGARCISSTNSARHTPGIIYGDGSINLVPESLLALNDNWRRNGVLAKKIVDLGRKVHESPFVHMSIMQDWGGETSSSEDDDETKSLSSMCSSMLDRKKALLDHGSEMTPSFQVGDDDASTTATSSSVGAPHQDCDNGMKARYKHEMSLQFPKQICYRFIMKSNEQPNTTFPESKLRTVPDEPPNVRAQALNTSRPPNRTMNARGDKQSRSNGLPLKEVTSANFLNVKQRRSARITAAPVKAPAAIGAGVRPFKYPQTQAQSQLESQVQAQGHLNSAKLRLDVPRRDVPLQEQIDECAEQFDKCTAIQADDNEEMEADGANAVVTRLLSPPNKCFFCAGAFPDMYALLMHLRMCHPRLDIVYRGDDRSSVAANSSAPVYIDVFVRQNFDGGFEGPAIRQYMGMRNRDMPQRCTPNNKVTFILYRSEALAVRRMTKDLSIFFTQADREKRALKGNNAAYFGFRSRHPIANSSQQQTNSQDQEWMRQMVVRQMEDFVDLSRPEKEFMKMWNQYMLKPNTKALGRCHLYHTCRVFVETHRDELLEKDLRRAWMYHLVAQSDNGALDSDELHDLTMRLQLDYDPAQDVIHPVYRMKNANVDDQPSTSKRKVPPAWQRAQIHGPKTSILRSASYTGAAGPSSDTDEISKRFATSLIRDERRCSSCSTDETTRQLHTMKRHRECNLNKYLQPIGQSSTQIWLKIDEDADDNVHDNHLLLPKTER